VDHEQRPIHKQQQQQRTQHRPPRHRPSLSRAFIPGTEKQTQLGPAQTRANLKNISANALGSETWEFLNRNLKERKNK
jgi:hypothetical protein